MVTINKLDKEITKNVKKLRKKFSLTTIDISTHLNVSNAFVRNVEAGYKKYNLKDLYLMYCLFYELDPSVTFDMIMYSYDSDLIIELQDMKKINNKYIKDE